MSNCEVAPKKMNHHEMLDAAIEDMDSVIKNAQNLLAKINGNLCDSSEPETDAARPSLVSVLNDAPQTIRKKNEELHVLLNNITEQLF